MRLQGWKWVGLAFGLFLSSSSVALAQRPAHFHPVRPPISPYFFYSAINTTGLPNYYSHVLPAQQFRAFIARTDPYAARPTERITLTGDRVDQLIERQLQLRSTTGVGAPATAGTFMEYSHFFQPQQPGRRR